MVQYNSPGFISMPFDGGLMKANSKWQIHLERHSVLCSNDIQARCTTTWKEGVTFKPRQHHVVIPHTQHSAITDTYFYRQLLRQAHIYKGWCQALLFSISDGFYAERWLLTFWHIDVKSMDPFFCSFA